MKRKTTELEQKLIANHWYLELKTYTGKHSNVTLTYDYHKEIDGVDHLISLDKTRTKVVKFGIPNIYVKLLDKEELLDLHNKFMVFRDFVAEITKDIPEELLESE